MRVESAKADRAGTTSERFDAVYEQQTVTDTAARLEPHLAERYRIQRELGEGGMATVYLAEDIRHHRKVAIKVLHPELSAVLGPERFLKEIELTANLQHPHILPLFDSGAAEGLLYYVMPYVDGESLRTRLDREHQLPVADAIRIACDVASALEYAHKRGVVHRDIKPENILLHDGRPVVADFGIALAVENAGGTRMTQTGMSLGTPNYMAPEQAMGERDITPRSDIYALGYVLYEMLVGEPPFTGPTAQAVIARVVTEEPRSLVLQRKTVPPHVEAAVHTALAKIPADRFATAAQFAEALGRTDYAMPTMQRTSMRTTRRPLRHRALLVLPWALVAIAGAAGAWGWMRPPDKPVTRQRVMLWRTATPINVVGRFLALSPDGNTIAFVDTVGGTQQIWIKERDRLDPVAIAGTVDPVSPVFSPDGEWIAFAAGGKLKKVPRLGGSAITLADSIGPGPSIAWLDDGTVLFTGTELQLLAVSNEGGPQRRLSRADSASRGIVSITGLPGGRAALIGTCSPGCPDADLRALDLRSGEERVLTSEVLKAWYLDGLVVFVRRDGGVFAVPFDPNELEFRGSPVPVLDGVRTSLVVADMALSPNGTLVYIAGLAQAGALVEPVWVTRRGEVSLVDSGWSYVLAANSGIALSPDGRRLALGARASGSEDIWIKELDRGPLRRLTFDGANARPMWTRDGSSVIYTSVKQGIGNSDLRQRRADGTGAEETVVDLPRGVFQMALTPDTAALIVRLGQPPTRDIVLVRRGGGAPTPLVAEDRYEEVAPMLSPDGRWLAYASNESGRYEIYVRPFPDVNAGKWQLSRDGGMEPVWAHSGRELFYRDRAGNLIAAQITTGSAFSVGEQTRLFSARGLQSFLVSRAYDVTPDDRRFVFTRAVGSENQDVQPVIHVENWISEVRNITNRGGR